MRLEDILVRPLITEKASAATELFNRYGFEVGLKANKNQIKIAIEKLYDVRVIDVKTNITAGKTKKTAKGGTRKSSKIKKAYIQLGEGQKIEFFKNV